MEPTTERFERIFRSHARAVYAYARRRAGHEAGEEVLANTFLVAWRRFDQLPPDHELAWLLGTARLQLQNHLRGERRREALAVRVADASTRAQEPIDEPTDSATMAALADVSPTERELLCLIAWEGLDRDQLARVLGVSRVALRVRLHRARRRFAQALERHEREAAGREGPSHQEEPWPTR